MLKVNNHPPSPCQLTPCNLKSACHTNPCPGMSWRATFRRCKVTTSQGMHVMRHQMMCHAKVVHLLLMSCLDTDLHVMSPPSFSCPFVSRDVSGNHECHVISAGTSPHMSCQDRPSQGMSAKIHSHVLAYRKFRSWFPLSHINLLSHCLALLLPDSPSVSPSGSLKLSCCYVLTLPAPRGFCPLTLLGCDRSCKFHTVFASLPSIKINIMPCAFAS